MKKQGLQQLIKSWFKHMLHEEVEFLPEKFREKYSEWEPNDILIFSSPLFKEGWKVGNSPSYIIAETEHGWEYGILTKVDPGSRLQPEDWDMVYPLHQLIATPEGAARALILALLTEQVDNIYENFVMSWGENEG